MLTKFCCISNLHTYNDQMKITGPLDIPPNKLQDLHLAVHEWIWILNFLWSLAGI